MLGVVRQGVTPDEVAQRREGTDVVTVLRQAHGEALALLEELETTPGLLSGGSAQDVARRIAIVDVLVTTLSAHEAAEEQIFWPAVADVVDAGPSIAELARRQERESKAVLAEVRRAEMGDAQRFEAQVVRLGAVLREHVQFEEVVFERVIAQVAEPSRRSLGRRVARAARRGPTRPHPHTPSGAAALHVAGPLGAAIDRIRDKVVRRPASGLDPEVVRRARLVGAQLHQLRSQQWSAETTAGDNAGNGSSIALPHDAVPVPPGIRVGGAPPSVHQARPMTQHRYLVLGALAGGTALVGACARGTDRRGLARIAVLGVAGAAALLLVALVHDLSVLLPPHRPPVLGNRRWH